MPYKKLMPIVLGVMCSLLFYSTTTQAEWLGPFCMDITNKNINYSDLGKDDLLVIYIESNYLILDSYVITEAGKMYNVSGIVINGPNLVFNWGNGYTVWGDAATYPFKMHSLVDFGDRFRGDDFELTQVFCPPGLVSKDLDFDTLDGTIPWCEDEEDCPFIDSAF